MAMYLGEATITPGTISGDVRTIQQILTGQGYNAGPIDGNFGPQTLAAVQAFQKTKGLVPDGVVGPLTWDALHGKTSAASLPIVQPVASSRLAMASDVSSIAGLGVGLLALALVFASPAKRRRR